MSVELGDIQVGNAEDAIGGFDAVDALEGIGDFLLPRGGGKWRNVGSDIHAHAFFNAYATNGAGSFYGNFIEGHSEYNLVFKKTRCCA